VAIPAAILWFELGVAFRRKGRGIRFVFWGLTFSSGLLAAVWIYFRGDLYSDDWVRILLGSFGILA
jgi:hypothetical protein